MVHFTIPHVRLVVMIPLLYTKQAEFFFLHCSISHHQFFSGYLKKGFLKVDHFPGTFWG